MCFENATFANLVSTILPNHERADGCFINAYHIIYVILLYRAVELFQLVVNVYFFAVTMTWLMTKVFVSVFDFCLSQPSQHVPLKCQELETLFSTQFEALQW